METNKKIMTKEQRKEFSDTMLQITIGLLPEFREIVELPGQDKDELMFQNAYDLAKKFIEFRDKRLEAEGVDISE